MITIKIKCIDQTLTILNAPIIASGGIEENNIEFEFCSKWDGLVKTGVFYRSANEVYNVLLENDKCVIPHEVLRDKGFFYFGVFGVKDNKRYTTEVLRYNIEQGSYILGSESLEPTPDIYSTIVQQYAQINETYNNIFKDLKGAVGDMCAKGFVNLNDNEEYVGFWVGTQEEYDALENYEPDIYYCITDTDATTSDNAKNVSESIGGRLLEDIFVDIKTDGMVKYSEKARNVEGLLLDTAIVNVDSEDNSIIDAKLIGDYFEVDENGNFTGNIKNAKNSNNVSETIKGVPIEDIFVFDDGDNATPEVYNAQKSKNADISELITGKKMWNSTTPLESVIISKTGLYVCTIGTYSSGDILQGYYTAIISVYDLTKDCTSPCFDTGGLLYVFYNYSGKELWIHEENTSVYYHKFVDVRLLVEF